MDWHLGWFLHLDWLHIAAPCLKTKWLDHHDSHLNYGGTSFVWVLVDVKVPITPYRIFKNLS